jgi:hypothetical protein
MPEDFDALDHGDIGMVEDPLPDDESDMFVLFADALDPDTPSTVEEREAEWKELFGGG